MIWRSTILSSLLLGLLCLNFAFVKSGPLVGDAINPPFIPNAEDGNDMDSSDFATTAFSSILQSKLWSSDILISLFQNPIDEETAATIASAVAESLVLEVGIVDSYSATDLIIDALLSVNPNAGPEEYCTELTNVVGKILLNNKILNSENYFTFANTISRIILNVASDFLNAMKKIAPININKVSKDVGAGFDIGDNVPGLQLKSDNLDTMANLKPLLGVSGYDIGDNVLGLQLKSDNLDTMANLKPLLGVNANVGLPLGANLNTAVDTSINSDVSASEEANIEFKLRLTNELLKDMTFRNVFSDYIPANVLKQISAAVCQYISKAFHISRLSLLPLETSIGNLSFESSPTPELYGNTITSILTDLFSKAKFITKGTASLQGIIAANAITSGIASLIRIAAIPGVGFSINENTFNSYFSTLNGLEKLPYVGVEAASLPLSIKLTYASRYASQFAKILFYNLVSSSKFLEIFSPGVSAVTNKLTAKSLGNFVAEAFGSPNRNLFYDLYCNALLSSALNVNRVNYARALSSATARGLFLNGYFLSGNINIQAAIAKNAIIRALTTRAGPVTTERVFFQILGLPWVTQLEGVSPSQILLKYGTDVGLNAGVGKSINTKNNAALGAGANMNSGLGEDLRINAGLRERLSTDIGLGGGSGTKVGLGGVVGANVGLGGAVGANVGLGGVVGANVGLGEGLGSNVGLKGRVGANIGLAGGQATNIGLGGGLGAKVGLGEELSRNLALGEGLSTNVDLRGRFDENLGLGGELGAGIGLRGDLASNFGLSDALGTNMGLAEGLGSKMYLGTGLDINDGLGARLSADIGLGAVSGVNTGFGELSGVNTGLGAVDGLNMNSGAAAGLNTGLGIENGLNSAFQGGRNVNFGLKNGLDVKSGLGTSFDATDGLRSRTNRKKRSINDLSTITGVNLGTSINAGVGLDSDVYLGAGVDAGVDAGLAILDKNAANTRFLTGVNRGSDVGTNLGARLGINTLRTNTNLFPAAGSTSNAQLSVLSVLPVILADKLYRSTALYTSVSMVGARKIINLISQAMAAEFGLPVATILLRSYEQFVIDKVDNTFEIIVVGLAKSTTEALAATGLLSSKFSLLTANQLTDAVVSKFSSLIATSLETKACTSRPQWTNLLGQGLVQPPLISEYNVFK